MVSSRKAVWLEQSAGGSMVPGWGRAQTALGAIVTTLALTSVTGGHCRVLRRAETGSDLGFKWIVLAAAVLKEGEEGAGMEAEAPGKGL